MNITCSLQQRRIARQIASGAYDTHVLNGHLTRCPRCRQAVEELTALATSLQMRQEVPHSSPDLFEAAVWERLAAEPHSYTDRPIPATFGLPLRALAAACACAVLLVGIWLWTSRGEVTRPTSGLPLVASKDPSGGNAPDKGRPVARTESSGVKKTPNIVAQVRDRTIRNGLLADSRPGRSRHLIHKRHPLRLVKHLPTRRLLPAHVPEKAVDQTRIASAKPPAIPVSVQWARLGQQYEASGDYCRARDAYTQAYRTAPEPAPGLAFAAGRAAESAGDMAGAIQLYSQLLSRPSTGKPEAEKGSLRWNDDHNTA